MARRNPHPPRFDSPRCSSKAYMWLFDGGKLMNCNGHQRSWAAYPDFDADAAFSATAVACTADEHHACSTGLGQCCAHDCQQEALRTTKIRPLFWQASRIKSHHHRSSAKLPPAAWSGPLWNINSARKRGHHFYNTAEPEEPEDHFASAYPKNTRNILTEMLVCCRRDGIAQLWQTHQSRNFSVYLFEWSQEALSMNM